MDDFEIDLRHIFLSFWKIRYHLLFFPFICILLVIAHSLTGKILQKNKLVYYIQFTDTKSGNVAFLQDMSTLLVYKVIAEKWGLDPLKLRNSIIVEGISPKSSFIREKFKIKLSEPGIGPAEIDELGNVMVSEIKNTNKMSARISFSYEQFGLSIDQASEILISLPSLWNKITSRSNLENLVMFPDLKKTQMKTKSSEDNTNLKNLNTYQQISNAIDSMKNLQKSDPRGYLLLTSKNGLKGSEIIAKMEMLKSIYLIPFFNSAVTKNTTDIVAFLNNYKMDKLEIEEKLKGIESTIDYLKKDNVILDSDIVRNSLERNENTFKALTKSRNSLESQLFVDLLLEKNTLEKELAKTKRDIHQIERIKYQGAPVTSKMYRQINQVLSTYNVFLDTYKQNLYVKDDRVFNALIKPSLIGSSKLINKLHLLLAALTGLCIGTAYGLILLLIRPNTSKNKQLVNNIKN